MEAVAGLLLMLFGVSHASVSSVLLVSECLSQGEMRVSCSSEGGDSPQYSWTLDGRTLTDAELFSGNNESNIITLKQHVSGYLACSVRNNISNVFNKERISTCGFIFINCTSVSGTQISECVHKTNNTVCTEPAQCSVGNMSLIGGGLSALVIFIAVSAAIICSEKKQNDKRLKQNENGDGQEVYADVGVVAGEAKGENSRAAVNQVFKMNLPD
ncbi:uncharacterized protein LOC109204804 isoform X1 [Oreochromis niloticus]|uniref:uncharacterized protein LOC109204804 isoform X1 n=1 Tax=Oreochromis niloticus TaxID=8128 RepID=UPI000904C7E1|nr:uncharacterized protein LOC109204804 isoform X1 [Oreochromis niloticus]